MPVHELAIDSMCAAWRLAVEAASSKQTFVPGRSIAIQTSVFGVTTCSTEWIKYTGFRTLRLRAQILAN